MGDRVIGDLNRRSPDHPITRSPDHLIGDYARRLGGRISLVTVFGRSPRANPCSLRLERF
jgi:hypothetical protein